MPRSLTLSTALIFSLAITAFASDTVLADQAQRGNGDQKPINNEDKPEMICHPTTCYPREFVPTTTFQVVHSDQIVPPGLHIRLNIGSGGREAKLIDPNEEAGQAIYVEKERKEAPVMEYSDLIAIPSDEEDDKEDRQDLFNLKVNNSTGSRKVTYEESIQRRPVQNVKPNPNLSAADRLEFQNALDVLAKATPGTEGLEASLDYLQDASHEIEYGVLLVGDIYLRKLIEIIENEGYSSTCRQNAAISLGNAVQNNWTAYEGIKIAFGVTGIKNNLLKPILDALWNTKDGMVQRRLLFAISQLVWTQIEESLQQFLELNGLGVLEKVFNETSDAIVRGKIANLIESHNMYAVMQNPYDRSYAAGAAKSGGGSQKVVRTAVDDALVRWCGIFQKDLIDLDKEGNESDVSGRIVDSLAKLRERYGDSCAAHPKLNEWITKAKDAEDADSDGYKGLLLLENAFSRSSTA